MPLASEFGALAAAIAIVMALIARERDGEAEKIVAEGEFTFVAIDENNRPRIVSAKDEANG